MAFSAPMEGAFLDLARDAIQDIFDPIFDNDYFEVEEGGEGIWGEIMSVELPDAETLMNFLMMFAGTILVLTIVALADGGFIVIIRNRRGPTPRY